VVPFFGDQPFWGNCVARMNVGPNPIPYKELTKEKLAEAIIFCTKPEVKNQAKILGQKLKDEDGLQAAVDAFHKKLPVFEGVWVDEIHENMRKIAFKWTHALLPSERSAYTDKTGILELKFEGFKLPAGWEWQSEWKAKVVQGATDSEGWRYASSFGANVEWHDKEQQKDYVRTRKMMRRRIYTGNIPKVVQSKFLLYVDVIEGKDIISKDIGSDSDPYCKISLKSKKDPQMQKTHHINNTKTPVWKETFWYEASEEDTLIVECVDYDDVGSDDMIGTAEIVVQQITQKNLKEIWLDLMDKKKVCGSVHLGFSK